MLVRVIERMHSNTCAHSRVSNVRVRGNVSNECVVYYVLLCWQNTPLKRFDRLTCRLDPANAEMHWGSQRVSGNWQM